MNKEEILKKIRENRDKIRSFGVKRIGIFGSAVREEMTEKSDIDVVVEFEKGKATFKNVCGLVDFLEELFGREVDIFTPDGIDSMRIEHVREKIMKHTRDLSYEDFRRNDMVGKNEANNREKECPRQGNRSFAGDKLGVYSAC